MTKNNLRNRLIIIGAVITLFIVGATSVFASSLPTHFGPDSQINGQGPAGFGPHGGSIDYQALLAKALGITVEELEAAQEQARQEAMEQALAEGLITQEQADLMQARQALRDYLDPETLQAQALGITVEELQAEREAGKSMPELLNELGLDRNQVVEALQEAHQTAIAQAVSDGAITQEQADLLQNQENRGFRERGFGGQGGPGGFFDGPRPNGPHGNFHNGGDTPTESDDSL